MFRYTNLNTGYRSTTNKDHTNRQDCYNRACLYLTMQQNRYFLFLLLLLFTALIGCVSDPSIKWVESEVPDSLRNNAVFSHALDLEAEGNHAEAALMLERLAQTTRPPVKQEALLRAVENYLQVEDNDSAFRLLQLIGTDNLPRLGLKRRVLLAEVAIKGNSPDEALQLLEQPPERGMPPHLLRRYHKNRAEAFRLTGNMLESARHLTELDLLTQDPAARLDNQRNIVRNLTTYTDSALELLKPNPPGVFGGWIELTRAIRTNTNNPSMGPAAMQEWREEFSSHPALPQLLESQIQSVATGYSRPRQLAILLPKRGPYAKAALALHDGIMSAHNNQPEHERPGIRIYDSSNSSQVIAVYKRALRDGADRVIGPLVKESVTQMARAGSLEVPVLALNRIQTQAPPPDNLYQFGLAPEDEARQVAERAWVDGHTRAIVLTPQGSWGERIFNSFRDRWTNLGGSIVERQTYNTRENDFSIPIRTLLNIDESFQRRRSLRNALGRKIEFVPRRRQDADFIFLLAKTRMARQIRPQLQFHHATKLPVYTTSHSYSGKPAPKKDLDLEGVVFPDIPWLLTSEEDQPLSRIQIEQTLAKKSSSYGRLYAMGIDSYRMMPHLSRLRSSPRETLEGKTGILSIGQNNQIHRQLVWAKMKKGTPEVIGYAPRLEEKRSVSTPISKPRTRPSPGQSSDFFSW